MPPLLLLPPLVGWGWWCWVGCSPASRVDAARAARGTSRHGAHRDERGRQAPFDHGRALAQALRLEGEREGERRR